ncbi:MAG TPA: hypothetical protein VLA98_05385 [Solirubrobacteraceae bacterium]|nr:hypothetical protein [Solirubrobacteraceae bacterium]
MRAENCGGELFHTGHTCGDCQRLYFARHAHSCTWGVDPRLVAVLADHDGRTRPDAPDAGPRPS